MFQTIVTYMVIGTILLYVLNFLGKVYTNLKFFFHDKYMEFKMRKSAHKYIKEQKKLQKELTPEKFYGLFEFDFDECSDEENIKKDFCSIIKEKMDSKYKNTNLKINSTDKIFFNCNDFSKLDVIVDDFVKLFNFFADINKKRHIKTNLKFSLWSEAKDESLQKAYSVLSEINNLNFLNMVIVNDNICEQYQKQNLKMFEFVPNGLTKLMGNDEEFELYRLLKSSVAKGNNK